MVGFDVRRKLPVLLLIDDDLVSREVMATVLTMSGFTIHTAASGEAAVALVEGAGCASDAILPDVILMDTQMPELSGVALIRALRQRTDATIFAISASEPAGDVKAAADGFLLKPFDAETLKHALAGQKVHMHEAAPPGSAADDTVDEPAVDRKTLAQLRKMMPPQAVREIFEAVVKDLHNRLQDLAGSIARADTESIKKTGHAIKGGCGLAGAVEASRLGALLEATAGLGGGNQLDNVRLLERDLQAATRRLEVMLETELADREGSSPGGEV